MMNTWNDLLVKQELAGNQGVMQAQQQIYGNENDQLQMMNNHQFMGGSVMSANMGPQSHMVQQPHNGNPAAVAAAVTAMMMQQNPSNHNRSMNRDDINNNTDEMDDDDDNDDDDCNSSVNNDAEGVWSPDIEQSFQEALAIYPPCGRRKIILSEEGKMYGRNELIARYIKVRTGKTRSRKQVSSHIQVLAKRKTKDFHNHLKDGKDGKAVFPNPFSNLTSAQIISPTTIPPLPQNIINPVATAAAAVAAAQINNVRNGSNNQNSQMLQNCTNILPNNPNQSQIWSHPGLHPEKNLGPSSSSMPSSTNDNDLTPSSSSSSSSSSISNHHNHHHHNNENYLAGVGIHHLHHHNHLSPDTSPNGTNNQLWPIYTNNSNGLYNKCIIGSYQLRLIEFSGFLEKRRDPDIYHKHLFVHLNTSDCLPLQNSTPSKNSNSTSSTENEDFECINYKEFADKFPENDLIWTNNHDKLSATSYLIKFWVDLNYILEDDVSSVYAVTNIFESTEPMTISCSTKVCSFGNQVVEKVEIERGSYESSGRYVYRFENSPMCEYMVTFINKLKQLPDKSLKNSVLENFSVLQSIKNHDTKEVLLTLAYVFEVSTSEHGAQHVIYRLINK